MEIEVVKHEDQICVDLGKDAFGYENAVTGEVKSCPCQHGCSALSVPAEKDEVSHEDRPRFSLQQAGLVIRCCLRCRDRPTEEGSLRRSPPSSGALARHPIELPSLQAPRRPPRSALPSEHVQLAAGA